MKQTAKELETLVNEYVPLMKNICEDVLFFKPPPDKWSKKEIIGHLIDSALSNSRRFIVAQYEEAPKIVYAQVEWVVASAYQSYNTDELIHLWALLNKHICHILENTPEHLWQRTCMTEQLHTIEWVAADYVKHLKHHMHAVLDMEPVAYP
ncbi:MAG: DinB family protein [Bacteroidetes bacterium]|nr:MAG: DinB family protein [Bacteroidota bacterium]